MEKTKNILTGLLVLVIFITMINLIDRALVIEDDRLYEIGYNNFKSSDYGRQVLLLKGLNNGK